MSAPLYLRDLSDSMKAEFERDIKSKHPKLSKSLEEGEDIQIGSLWEEDSWRRA